MFTFGNHVDSICCKATVNKLMLWKEEPSLQPKTTHYDSFIICYFICCPVVYMFIAEIRFCKLEEKNWQARFEIYYQPCILFSEYGWPCGTKSWQVSSGLASCRAAGLCCRCLPQIGAQWTSAGSKGQGKQTGHRVRGEWTFKIGQFTPCANSPGGHLVSLIASVWMDGEAGFGQAQASHKDIICHYIKLGPKDLMWQHSPELCLVLCGGSYNQTELYRVVYMNNTIGLHHPTGCQNSSIYQWLCFSWDFDSRIKSNFLLWIFPMTLPLHGVKLKKYINSDYWLWVRFKSMVIKGCNCITFWVGQVQIPKGRWLPYNAFANYSHGTQRSHWVFLRVERQ